MGASGGGSDLWQHHRGRGRRQSVPCGCCGLNSVLNVVSQYPAAQSRGMDTVSPVKLRAVPEQIEVINETEPAQSAGGLEPGAEAEKSAEAPHTTGE